MGQSIIEIRDLWFSYNGQSVLEDVNLTVHGGDFMAVIGPNGGGKTTLIKLILGLLQPSRGSITVFGRAPRQAAPQVGYVPQDLGANRTIPVTVEQVVLMGRMRGGFARFSEQDRKVARVALERVGMWDYRARRIGDLSGGQRQRVFVARALVSDPLLLLLDEPTASVDTAGQTQFYDFLKELNQTVTILVVSHDLMVLSSYIKSVACVSREVYFHDAPEITTDMIRAAYHCPVELIAHGLPHRVLPTHEDD
jgi:zinc transport system ATP-binding protein